MTLPAPNRELPPGWEAGSTADGRTYYVNHVTKTTTWEFPSVQPAPVAPAVGNFPLAAPVAATNAGIAVPVGVQANCNGRAIFWITAGLSWVVWVFAVAAAADDKWLANGFGLDSETYCGTVYENDEACDMVECWIGTQTVATILCSVGVVLFTVSFFRPFEAAVGSVRLLGMIGGIIMVLYAFFQMVSFSCFAAFVQEAEEEWGVAPSTGATFGVGVTAFIFGLVDAIMVLVFFRQAGDGPLLQCMGGAIAGIQQGQQQQQQHQEMVGQKPQHQGAVVFAQQQVVSAAPPPAFAPEPAGQGLPPPYTESPRPANVY